MKKISLIVIVCFILSNVLLAQTKKSVAVPEFVGGNDEDGATLADLFGSRLANKNVFDVLARTSVEAIMKEHNFQRSGLTDDASIKELGRIVNADYIIVGKIGKLGRLNVLTVQMVNVLDGNIEAGGDTTFKDISDTLPYINSMIESIVKSSSASSLQDALALYENAEERVTLYDANRGFYYGERIIVIIKSLLNRGINATNENDSYRLDDYDHGYTALHYASVSGYIEIVEALIVAGAYTEAKSNSGKTALMLAVSSRLGYVSQTDTIKLLIDKGAYIEAKDESGYTALMRAAIKTMTDTDAIKLLIDRGANVNAKGNSGETALILAAQFGDAEVVNFLIDRGATNVNAKDEGGYTALMQAAWNGETEVVKVLIDRGANVNAKNNWGWTALIYAASGNGWSDGRLIDASTQIEKIKVLIAVGAQVNAKSNYGQTALMRAAWNGEPEMVKVLIDRGANVNAKNNDGETAFSLAGAEYGVENREEIQKLLKAAGARE